MSATIAPSANMTYEEFLSIGDDGKKAEWVEGVVIEMSPESSDHQEVTGFLLAALSIFVEEKQLGFIRFERFQMKTAPNLPGREPDVMFISHESASRLRDTYLEGPADLAVEVVSLESRKRDRDDKFYEYEQGGVREYWLIDPAREQAEFYQRAENGFYILAAPDAKGDYHSLVLPGLRFHVDWLWRRPLPSVLSVLKEWDIVS